MAFYFSNLILQTANDKKYGEKSELQKGKNNEFTK